jgi:hypothetical protein
LIFGSCDDLIIVVVVVVVVVAYRRDCDDDGGGVVVDRPMKAHLKKVLGIVLPTPTPNAVTFSAINIVCTTNTATDNSSSK